MSGFFRDYYLEYVKCFALLNYMEKNNCGDIDNMQKRIVEIRKKMLLHCIERRKNV